MCLALPGRLEERTEGPGGLPFGRVRFGSVTQEICLAYVPDAAPGDWLIAHVGFAIQRLDEQAALRTLALLDGPAGEDAGPTRSEAGPAGSR